MKTINLKTFVLIVCVIVSALSCRDDMDGKTFLTSDDVMIDDYITQRDPSMTAFLEVVDKAGFRGMLHAYGTYTCFIPDNQAMSEYMSRIGKSNVGQLSVDECVEMVKYHVIRDTLRSVDFVDGRLQTANMMAKYLTTRTREIGGIVTVQVNRQAAVLQRDIKAANGYIHKIDNVLTPPSQTIGEQLMELPGDFSFFKDLMNRTGWVDTLTRNRADNEWYTVFLQNNRNFAETGINNENDLIERLKEARPDIEDTDSLLWTFCAYHCVKGLYYVADLSYTSALLSQAPNQALTIKLKKDSLLVNEYINVAAGVIEKGVAIDKKSEYTDYSCYNGVLVDLDGYITPIRRQARAVFWDVCEQPEFMKNSNFRKAGWTLTRQEFEALSEISCTIVATPGSSDFAYEYGSGYSNNGQYVYGDRLKVNFGRMQDISFKLPLLTEGTYNVWMCWRRAGTGSQKVRGVFIQDGQEEQQMSNVILPYEYFSTGADAQVKLASGMKRYTAKERNSVHNSRLLGTIVVQSTGRHTLRLDVLARGTATSIWLDMFHFIPIDDDQLWPRHDMQGTAIYEGTPCNEIWPFDRDCSESNDTH